MKHPPRTVTADLIDAALGCIPANCPRDEWAKVLASVKSQFDDETGFALVDQWSATAPENYSEKSTRATWKSVKACGGVTIASLFFLAKQHGFVMPKADQSAPPPDPEAVARMARERTERQHAEQVRQQAAHERAAVEAAALWQQASVTGASPYLIRKNVQPFGVRFTPDGRVLVPLRDVAGKLWNLQTICPSKPDSGPEKSFLKGSKKSGLFHILGDVAGPAVICVAEGFATAATIFEATGHVTVCAFDAGNLAPVCKALHQAHPAALIVACGDDDLQTFKRTGGNPGRAKAEAAARSVRGLAVFPENLPDGASDFNDAHATHGLDAVRATIEAAISTHQAAQTAARAAQTETTGKHTRSTQRTPSGATIDHGTTGTTGNDGDPFFVSDGGVFFCGVDRDGKKKSPEWICSRLDVTAATRDLDSGNWGFFLSFPDPLGHIKTWPMPARLLAGDGAELRGQLLSMGLRISTSPRARTLLTNYLQTRTPIEYAICTDKTGWHGGRVFVLPTQSIGAGTERVVFQADSAVENVYRAKGSPEQWRERVAAMCIGNSRLIFSVCCSLAGPLLKPAGMESGGFHIYGDSSSGKSTAQNVAASIYGAPNFKRSFRQTDNAMEGVAAQHNDCVLLLDEISQCEPRVIGEVIYMLGNSEGKTRATRSATPRPPMRWKLIFLSTGEKQLTDIMADAQKRTNAGQETRLAAIPGDAGAGLGLFENLHGHAGGAAFATIITREAASTYGAAGIEWLQWLTDHADVLKTKIRSAAAALAAQMIPKDSAGQVQRVGARFALIGAAGEMATSAGVTGWPVGECERAASVCFAAWLAQRGGKGNAEILTMLRQVKRFFETNGEARFALWHRQGDDHSQKTLNRAGFRRVFCVDGAPFKDIGAAAKDFEPSHSYVLDQGGTVHYYVLPECFRTEICAGFDYKTVAALLVAHGIMVPSKGRAFDSKHRLPGMGKDPVPCYHITPAIFSIDV